MSYEPPSSLQCFEDFCFMQVLLSTSSVIPPGIRTGGWGAEGCPGRATRVETIASLL
jgi:hypothetical protein